MPAAASPPTLADTRLALQRLAVHVLARKRHGTTGRFGLRATPGGFGTPAFGADDAIEVVRVAGASVVHEVGGDTVAYVDLDGATLGALAELVAVDLTTELSVGDDTPELGAADEPLALDPAAATEVADWFDLGWRALDAVCAGASDPSTIQLWPEHFDAGCSVGVVPGGADRCNLGASPGDEAHPEPYLYVGPWSADRPGDLNYWNAPFGARLDRADLLVAADPAGAGAEFLQRGLDLLRGGA
ncbi:MAG: hypothetical protein H0W25_14015 [Acidimicrobiia bacterium]|nr:hypothetical protein [Acidimicrobiia bacterium]